MLIGNICTICTENDHKVQKVHMARELLRVRCFKKF